MRVVSFTPVRTRVVVVALADLESAWAELPEDWAAEWAQVDEEREAALPEYVGLVEGFLSASKNVDEFRAEMDSLSKRRNLWGFRGSNQMFLNQLVHAAEREPLEEALRAVISAPEDQTEALERVASFLTFLDAVRARAREIGVVEPQLGRVPAFVSFFWELGTRDEWPAFYPSSRDILEKHSLLEASLPPSEMYDRYRSAFIALRDQLEADTWSLEHFLFDLHSAENDSAGKQGAVQSDAIRTHIDALTRFSNVVLEGPPGAGKTYAVKGIANAWQAVTGRELIGTGVGEYAITMHPSTSYEDFVEGLRYDVDKQEFRPRPGFMRRAVDRAIDEPDKDFLVLLDEINRANVPKVLGDLLMGMEHSKRARWDADSGKWTPGFSTSLPYSEDVFFVPENLYVLGTRNSSDRSIAPMDSALRRRFAFIHTPPLGKTSLISALADARGEGIASKLVESVDRLVGLNRVLEEALGPDSVLGHSYLFDVEAGSAEDLEATQLEGLGIELPSNVERVFWLETRKNQGGSGNQVDLSGSEDFLYPLLTPTGIREEKDASREDEFAIRYRGRDYAGNVIRYQSGAPVWRLFLQGTTDDDSRLSAVASQDAGADEDPNARTFERRFLLFVKDQEGAIELHTVELSERDALHALTADVKRTTSGPQGREFGLILDHDTGDSSAGEGDASLAADEPRATWRYAILPQLVDSAVAAGAEELLDAQTRDEWLASNELPGLGPELEEFDRFLNSLGIALELIGTGLTRTLLIRDIDPDAAGAPASPAGLS